MNMSSKHRKKKQPSLPELNEQTSGRGAAAADTKPAPKAAAGAGSVKVAAQVPGKVLKIVASVGQAVKSGDSIVIVESMKMEIPVVAPQDGTVASIDVAEGASVENGDTLATLN